MSDGIDGGDDAAGDATQQVPAVAPGGPAGDRSDRPAQGRRALPWIVAGVAVVVALIVGVLALRSGDGGDGEELDVESASGGATTSKPGASDGAVAVDGSSGSEGGEKGAPGAGGAEASGSAPGDKGGAGGGTGGGAGTTAPSGSSTSTSSNSTTTSTVPRPGLDYSLPPVFGSATYRATLGLFPDPITVQVTGGGPVDASTVGGGCGGHTTAAPSFSLVYEGPTDGTLRFYFVGSGDPTMIVNTPSARFVCADDSFGTLSPTLDFDPSFGRYDVWIGTFTPTGTTAGTLHVTRNTDNHP